MSQLRCARISHSWYKMHHVDTYNKNVRLLDDHSVSVQFAGKGPDAIF
jgi:hypothetical protein